jgi:hypothetical protein
MTLFGVLSTGVLCLGAWMALSVGAFLKDNDKGLRFSLLGIGVLIYALLRVVVYFFLWFEGVLCGSL